MEKMIEEVTVWTVRDGELIKTSAEVFGWPHYTTDGEQMFVNTHFRTREEAIEYGIREYSAGVQLSLSDIERLKDRLKDANTELNKYKRYVNHLKFMQDNPQD